MIASTGLVGCGVGEIKVNKIKKTTYSLPEGIKVLNIKVKTLVFNMTKHKKMSILLTNQHCFGTQKAISK